MRKPDKYAVVGQPIAHSASPAIHRLFAEQFGEPIEYGRIDVAPDCFDQRVAEFFMSGGQGLNVTAPHKIAAHDLADYVSMHARVAGSVNTLALRPNGDLAGDNTDGTGLVRDLTRNLGLTLAGRRLLVVGAGGAARGILAALLGQQPSRLVLANRDASKARTVAGRFAALGPLDTAGLPELAGQSFDLIINATSASLKGMAPALPASVARDCVAYDMAYGKQPSPFLIWAQANGAGATHMGWGMLVEQAAESFYLWRGVRPNTAPLLAMSADLTPG